MSNLEQDKEIWNRQWDKLNPESEIRMWDYFGGRQWVSKFVPRYGKTLEAGCGLGRYNFYFSRFGINIEGIDFSESTIECLNTWKEKNNFNTVFKVANVTKLPYSDSSLRGYISLGVIEHFIEGPQQALLEAFRVLEPGGIAIITTPSISWYVLLVRIKGQFKKIIKSLINHPNRLPKFIQYEYRPKKLKYFVDQSGLYVSEYNSCDLLFPFSQMYNFSYQKILPGTFPYWFANKYEQTFLRIVGAQSITISIKTADIMYCFFCGKREASISSLNSYSIPVCKICEANNELIKYYQRGILPFYSEPYLINPMIKHSTKEICMISGDYYYTDEIFEDFGFTKKVKPDILKDPKINLEFCNTALQPIWRNRSNIELK